MYGGYVRVDLHHVFLCIGGCRAVFYFMAVDASRVFSEYIKRHIEHLQCSQQMVKTKKRHIPFGFPLYTQHVYSNTLILFIAHTLRYHTTM